MEVMTVTASRTVKVNLGNYESTDVFVSMTAALDELDNEAEAFAMLRALVDESVLLDLEDLYAARGKKDTRKALSRRYGVPDRA